MLAPTAVADTTFACVSGEACVHITFPGSGHAAVDVPASVIEGNEDLFAQPYDYLYSSGNGGTDVITGISLPTLLSSVIPNPINPDNVTYAIAVNPNNGYESPLMSGDLDSNSPFQNGLEPAFGVYGTGSTAQLEYIRPQRDDSDVNAPDRFIAGSADPVIDLQLYRSAARPLHPSVAVGKGPWQVGDHVGFSASFAADDPPHDGATFAWTFAVGDPSTPGQQSTSHTYTASGTYTVSVAVSGTGPNGEAYDGQSSGVTFRVGPAPVSTPTGGPSGGNGTGTKHHPSTGPDKSHHGHHAGSIPTRTPTSAPPAVVEPTGGSGPDGSSAPTPTTVASTTGPTRPALPAPPPATHAGSGAFVRGVLIDQPAIAGGVRVRAPTQGAVSARRPGRVGTPFDARWLWLLAPVLLLIAGALGERRRVPARHGPQSRL